MAPCLCLFKNQQHCNWCHGQKLGLVGATKELVRGSKVIGYSFHPITPTNTTTHPRNCHINWDLLGHCLIAVRVESWNCSVFMTPVWLVIYANLSQNRKQIFMCEKSAKTIGGWEGGKIIGSTNLLQHKTETYFWVVHTYRYFAH